MGVLIGPHLRQSSGVNTRPVTDFAMRPFAVVLGPTVGVEFSGLESTNDGFLVDGNTGLEKATVRPHRKTVWKESGFHACEIWSSVSMASCSKPAFDESIIETTSRTEG